MYKQGEAFEHGSEQWTRAKVFELSSQGYNEREISETLKVSDSAVHRDLVVIGRQARENLQKHIHETVPEEYQKCMVGRKRNLKQTLEIAEITSDPKTKLQARAIANDCYKYIMDLTTGGVIVTDAIKYIQGQMAHLNTTEKKLLQDIKQKEDKEHNIKKKILSSKKLRMGFSDTILTPCL